MRENPERYLILTQEYFQARFLVVVTQNPFRQENQKSQGKKEEIMVAFPAGLRTSAGEFLSRSGEIREE